MLDQKPKRGFAAMIAADRSIISAKGGKAAHANGTAHEFDSDEAREAGRKGGLVVSKNREHMAEIGRRGGEAKNGKKSVIARAAPETVQK